MGHLTVPTSRTAGAEAADSRWFRRFVAPSATRRVFCIPYAGGSARIYRNWHDWLAPDVEVVAVEPPGRGVHLREEPLDDADALVESLLVAVEPLLDVPFAFFGHSMGALVAFELSRRLVERGRTPPVHLFVSAMRAPHLEPREPVLSVLSDEEFLAAIRALEGTLPEVLEDRELLSIVLPVLRADFRLSETYRCRGIVPLPLPITVFGGLQDERIFRADLEAWQRHTAQRCLIRLLPGNHFFIHEYEHLIAASVLASLAEPDAGPGAGAGHRA